MISFNYFHFKAEFSHNCIYNFYLFKKLKRISFWYLHPCHRCRQTEDFRIFLFSCLFFPENYAPNLETVFSLFCPDPAVFRLSARTVFILYLCAAGTYDSIITVFCLNKNKTGKIPASGPTKWPRVWSAAALWQPRRHVLRSYISIYNKNSRDICNQQHLLFVL